MAFDHRIYGSTEEPTQTYWFSDAYGTDDGHPFRRPQADELVTTDLRSGFERPIQREFDIYHNPDVTDHILRTIVSVRDQKLENLSKRGRADRAEGRITGVFINSAPRTNGGNGKPFYVAETDNGVRIVTTPLEALSAIRNRIVRLGYLPNEGNKLYEDTEQFRSSHTPELLYPDHGLDLVAEDPSIIPAYAHGELHVAWIDRYGNIVTYTESLKEDWQRILDEAAKNRGKVFLTINGVTREVDVGVNTCLGTNKPDKLTIYHNGGLDLARKWKDGETPKERLERSAFGQFSEIRAWYQKLLGYEDQLVQIGDNVTIGRHARKKLV